MSSISVKPSLKDFDDSCVIVLSPVCDTFLFRVPPSSAQKGGAACVSCRGDWYAQGNHARDAAKHATTADARGFPHATSAAETLWYSCPVLCIPLSNDYQSFDRIRWNYTTIPLKHTSRHMFIRMTAEKCDSSDAARCRISLVRHAWQLNAARRRISLVRHAWQLNAARCRISLVRSRYVAAQGDAPSLVRPINAARCRISLKGASQNQTRSKSSYPCFTYTGTPELPGLREIYLATRAKCLASRTRRSQLSCCQTPPVLPIRRFINFAV